MRYPIAIEPGSEATAFGVVVPDLPGCFSAGDTLEEATENAASAIAVWIAATRAAHESVPAASELGELQSRHPELAGWIWAEASAA